MHFVHTFFSFIIFSYNKTNIHYSQQTYQKNMFYVKMSKNFSTYANFTYIQKWPYASNTYNQMTICVFHIHSKMIICIQHIQPKLTVCIQPIPQNDHTQTSHTLKNDCMHSTHTTKNDCMCSTHTTKMTIRKLHIPQKWLWKKLINHKIAEY